MICIQSGKEIYADALGNQVYGIAYEAYPKANIGGDSWEELKWSFSDLTSRGAAASQLEDMDQRLKETENIYVAVFKNTSSNYRKRCQW